MRIAASKHIFRQMKKTKTVDRDETFNEHIVDLSNIDYDGKYYRGFLFVPSVAQSYFEYRRRTTVADAVDCESIGPHSYGTAFEIIT